MEGLTVGSRIAVGLWLLAAGLLKSRDGQAFRRAVRHYRVLPRPLATAYGAIIPPSEIAIALLLGSGLAVGLAGLLAALLILSFATAVGLNIHRNRAFDCHCLGSALPMRIGLHTLTLDVLLLVPAMFLVGSRIHGVGLLASGWPIEGGAWSAVGVALGLCYALFSGVPLLLKTTFWQSDSGDPHLYPD